VRVVKEELVVLVELCSGASVLASISAMGATANPFVGLVVVVLAVLVASVLVELVELVVVATVATLVALVDAAATLGTAVHRRPLMVVRKAPDARPLDAIFQPQPLFDALMFRSQSSRTKRMG
jgi:hypothetical protein